MKVYYHPKYDYIILVKGVWVTQERVTFARGPYTLLDFKYIGVL